MSWPAPLHVRMFLSVIAICALLIGLDGWWTWQSRKVAIADDLASTANLARSLAEHAHNTIQVADTILLALQERTKIASLTPEEIERWQKIMRDQLATIPAIHGLFIVDEAGNRIAGSLPPSESTFAIGERAYFQYHRDHADPGMQIGRPVQKADNSWIITVSRRVNRPDGRFGGIVLATISVDFLERFYRSFDVGKNGVIALDRADGIAMVRNSGSPDGSAPTCPTWSSSASFCRSRRRRASTMCRRSTEWPGWSAITALRITPSSRS